MAKKPRPWAGKCGVQIPLELVGLLGFHGLHTEMLPIPLPLHHGVQRKGRVRGQYSLGASCPRPLPGSQLFTWGQAAC